MTKSIITLATAALSTLATTVPADAQRMRGHTVSIQGANGGSAVQSRSISRYPGGASAQRSFQTSGGRGVTSDRNASWSDGSYTSNRTTTANNGATINRTTTATNNGDGTATIGTTATGPNGQTRGGNAVISHY